MLKRHSIRDLFRSAAFLTVGAVAGAVYGAGKAALNGQSAVYGAMRGAAEATCMGLVAATTNVIKSDTSAFVAIPAIIGAATISDIAAGSGHSLTPIMPMVLGYLAGDLIQTCLFRPNISGSFWYKAGHLNKPMEPI